MHTGLSVGAAEKEITPPVGAQMAGSLFPRPAKGVCDPLFIKAIVLESQGIRLAYLIFDVAMLDQDTGNRIIKAINTRTGIPADHIIWSCTHTHSGPISIEGVFPDDVPEPTDRTWLATLASIAADCVAAADRVKVPAVMTRTRGYQNDVSHNRRLHYKDGREINTWLLNQGEENIQCVGAAAPIDPEVGILAFADTTGRMLAVIHHFSLHANSLGGNAFSADYPGIVAARLRERYGPQVISLYMPGACGDLNPVRSHREIGNALADVIINRLNNASPISDPVLLGACRRVLTLPLRDFNTDQESRVKASQWDPAGQDFFRKSQASVRRKGRIQTEAVLSAWHIGDTAFACFPGELFVEHGFRIKQESPFAWTFPLELSGGYLGYLVTDQAWTAGGYESLLSSVGLIPPGGCTRMVDETLSMLAQLKQALPR